MRSSMLRPRKNAMFSSIYRFGKSSLVVFSTARCCSGKILWLWFTHCQFFSDCLLEYSTIKMSFGLLFWLWKRQCLQVSAFSFRFRKQCWCKYLYIKLSLKLPKASLTTFYGLGGAKTSAGIGEGLRIPNAIRCHSGFGPPADLEPPPTPPPGPYLLADLDPPSQIWTPPQNIRFS